MLSLDMARYEIVQEADNPASFPALATALRAYGAGLTKWDQFIRKLLRSGGVDVNAQVPRKKKGTMNSKPWSLLSTTPCYL